MSRSIASRTHPQLNAPAAALARTETHDEREYARLLLGIQASTAKVAALEVAIAPLETALSSFEWEYQVRLGTLLSDLRELENTTQRIEYRSARVHARLVCDPGGILGDLFDREELMDIGELFGIEIPESWFAEEPPVERHDETWNFKGGSQSAEEEIFRQLQQRKLDKQRRADPDMRTLYRELARQFHPDLASDDADLTTRQEVMLRINAAWQNRDLAALQLIQLDTEHLMPDWHLSNITRRLAWARRESTSLGGQIESLQKRLQQLRGSDTFPLWFDAELGKTVIARQALALRSDIVKQRGKLDIAKESFRQALHAFAAASNIA
ncbi:MAG: J domain-containing protein [Thermomicrobiales bacterium]